MKSLIAFDATARLGSMTAAAEEERTTQPTISQRIRTLEENIGLPLFDRQGSRLTLTFQGDRFYREVAPHLKEIRKAFEQIVHDGKRPSPSIVIAAGSGFTHLWLLPRLPALKQAFPDLSFKLMPIDRADDPELQAADIAIRFGPHVPQDEGRLLASEAVFPVCSPSYAHEHNLSETFTEASLSDTLLLHQDIKDPRWLDWTQWLQCAGLSLTTQDDVFLYHNYALLLNATLAGQGIALGWSILVEDYLTTGQLISLEPRVKRENYGYWLSVKHHRSALIKPVSDWLIGAVHQ
ncbi:LysR substrate-binding domain-containing protein [Chromohalobacter canadensis]